MGRPRKPYPRAGETAGRWLVIDDNAVENDKTLAVICQCLGCGQEMYVRTTSLVPTARGCRSCAARKDLPPVPEPATAELITQGDLVLKVDDFIGKIIKWAESQGWTVEQTKGGRLRASGPGGQGLFFLPTSAGAGTARNNVLRDCRAGGLSFDGHPVFGNTSKDKPARPAILPPRAPQLAVVPDPEPEPEPVVEEPVAHPEPEAEREPDEFDAMFAQFSGRALNARREYARVLDEAGQELLHTVTKRVAELRDSTKEIREWQELAETQSDKVDQLEAALQSQQAAFEEQLAAKEAELAEFRQVFALMNRLSGGGAPATPLASS